MLIGVNMLSTGGGGGFAAPGATKNGLSSGSICGSAATTGRASLVGRNGPVDIDEDEDTSLALRFPRLLPEEEESGGPAGSAASCVAGGGIGSGFAAGCCDAGAYARMASQMSSSPNWE